MVSCVAEDNRAPAEEQPSDCPLTPPDINIILSPPRFRCSHPRSRGHAGAR